MTDTAVTKPNLFHFTRLPRPTVDRADGIYLWDKTGRRYIDGSSGAVNVNIGHGNRAAIEAMRRQMDRVSFAYTIHFESEPALALARELAARLPEGLDRIYYVSGGSEAVEACLKLARQWAVATGQPERWKIIGRMPSYHGITVGSLGVTGDEVLTPAFTPIGKAMPLVPAPFVHRDRDNLSLEERGLRYADMLEQKIVEEGADSVLAFIMEPIGGAASAALVPPDSYFARIREICDRHGILLIHDEVMTGIGRTGKFLGGDHWNCRPDIVALSKGLSSGYAPLGAVAATEKVVGPVLEMGGFLHGHTYGGNPVATAAGLAVLGEIDRLGLIDNATAMGAVLKGELEALTQRFPFVADVRGKGLLLGAELYADPVAKTPLPREWNANVRLIDLAFERGLIIYSRRVRGGPESDNFMVCPPLIVTAEQIGEIVAVLADTLQALAGELGLPVNS
ncbi:aspartate aminotransferase family protein [Terribium terrae]|jgi:adenosylmethionine-8-amino-7-oxononanoate aminotransferase|uniref:aminotransferase family protein n=1 Tax=Phyllobacteriaceae TaxID=69277 RepID=UPI000466BE5E|nr:MULTISPECIES: aspartate aminotransferase family protein [Mesorhizobium]MDQ0332464.1 adenosylmethionine-8-amino-7-oxononanoate aminotransferase [Mesorhizobium sp. YL-MeA3-2017]